MNQKQRDNTEFFKELDPYIKKNPDIKNYTMFKENNPELAAKTNTGTFGNRRCLILGLEGYGNKINKSKRKYKKRVKKKEINPELFDKEILKDKKVKAYINKAFSQSKYKKEFLNIASVLVKHPEIPFTKISPIFNLEFSNPTYYIFRKRFNIWYSKQKKNEIKKVETETKKTVTFPPNKNVIYTTIFTEKLNPNEDKSLLQRFISSMNDQKIANNWQVFEVVPFAENGGETQERYIEVRSYSK